MVEPTVAALLADVQNGQALAQAVEARLGQQDAAMASLVRRDEVGPGFLFVLAKAQEVAYANNADDAKALLGHLTSTLRKELRLAPAHALVSQLLAAPTAEARYALLARHVPTQQTLPLNRAGGALPL